MTLLSIQDCFRDQWVEVKGAYWATSGGDKDSCKIHMNYYSGGKTCPGNADECHWCDKGIPTAFTFGSNNYTVTMTKAYVGTGYNVTISKDDEPEEPEPEETDVQTARINDFSITGHSPYMVGSMINFEVDVEWLADTRLCIAVTPAFTSNNTWYSCGPTSGKNSNEETKGTKIRYKGAFTVSADMLKHTNQQLGVYFIVTDNNSYIEQDYKFIPIQVIEPTYPDDDPIWDDPDPIDPVDPDDPNVIPEIDNNIWFYVTIILFIGLIGVMIWSSR